MIAISLDDCKEVPLPKPGDDPNQVRTFYVRPLSERAWRQFLNLAGKQFGLAFLSGGFNQEQLRESMPELGDMAAHLLQYGLAGWKNARGLNGKTVPFHADDDGGVDIEPLFLKGVERGALFYAILFANMVEEEEEKNSSEPLSSERGSSA